MPSSPLYGLVLSGGQSLRMGQDKGQITYPPRQIDQRTHCFKLLSLVCEKTFVSARSEQKNLISPELPIIFDSVLGSGPATGIVSAAKFFPEAAWLVLACDFPFADEKEIRHLRDARSDRHHAYGFTHSDGTIEPLFTIWERPALEQLKQDFETNQFSPRQTLSECSFRSIVPLNPKSLVNVNSKLDLDLDEI